MQDNNTPNNNKWLYRSGIFVLFLICGLLVFLINMTFTGIIPQEVGIILKIGLVILFFTSAIILYRNKRLNKYWNVFFAFFIVSIAALSSLYLSKSSLRFFGLKINTLNGFTMYKFLEDLFIVVFIIVLTRISGGDMASIYLKKGNLKLGLIIGLTSFFVLYLLSVLQTTAQNISFEKFISLTPWILVIILADGFMEELLFRGLFLKKYASFIGAKLSILLTALIYTLTHLQVTFAPELVSFLIIVFILGLVWGYIIQKTDSLWGSVLFHAGADALIIIQALPSFGITLQKIS